MTRGELGVAILGTALLVAVSCDAASQSPNQASVAMSQATYGPGEAIDFAIVNGAGEPILVPLGTDWCASVAIERQDGAEWQGVDGCSSAPTALFSIDSGDSASGTVAMAAHRVPVPSSVPAARFDGDLRDLPVQSTPAPGERVPPASEVPIGILPGDGSATPESRAPDEGSPPAAGIAMELGQGTYRVLVRYLVGSPAGPELRAYSEAFLVGTTGSGHLRGLHHPV